MRRLLLVVLSAALLIAGCSSTGGAADANPPTGTNAANSAGQEPTSSAETTTEAPEDTTVAFGKSFTWEDGVTVTVSTPKAYKPSEYAAGVEGKKHVALTITLVNKTGKAFDPGLLTMTMQSGDAEASQIYDSENGIEGEPSTKLLNGRQAKFKVAFSVADPNDLVLELSPDFEHDSAIWTSGA